MIDVGPLHLLEKLAHVHREALDVLSLSLGQQRVECQRAFARSADAGDYDEPIARDIDIDILQVVRAGAADLNRSTHSGPGYPLPALIERMFGPGDIVGTGPAGPGSPRVLPDAARPSSRSRR